MKRFLSGLLACGALWATGAQMAQSAPLFEPGANWSTLETKHFRIYYTTPFAGKASQIAGIAEDAYAKLVPYMQVAPNGPTEVILADGYDQLNSLATDSPQRAVWLWMTPPNPDDGMWIGRYDQWMRLLFTHEFTHILQFQHTPGVLKLANSALGGLLLSGFPQLPIDITLNLPDLLTNMPAFIAEGQAVYTESTFTPGGRANEGDFDMIRRMAALENRTPPLDQVWGRYLVDWPVAGLEYTWGVSFIQYMVKTYGPDAPVKVLKAYGPFPYLGFDFAVHRVLGVGVNDIWEGMIGDLNKRYEAQAQAYKARHANFAWPLASQVTTTGRYHRHPAWADAHTLMYGEALYNQSPELISEDLNSHERTPLIHKSTRSAVSLGPGARKMYFEQDTQDSFNKLSSFRDTFVYDRQTDKVQRLTHGARTFTPTISPDGERIAAVISGEGQSGMAIFDKNGRLLRQWRYDNNLYQFGNPAWSPDGHLLAVSVWQGGSRDIWLLDPATGEKTRLWQDKPVDFYPSWSPDGRYVLFTSDRSGGIFNLFAYELTTRKLSQLTDVLGGAFDPAVSPDGKTLAFINYTGRGYDVQTQRFAPETSPDIAELPLPGPIEDQPDTVPPITPESISAYNPLPTLLPSVWFPVLGQDEHGSFLTLYTFWEDVLRQHELFLSAGYGIFSQHLSYGFNYQNNQTPLQWNLSMNEYPLQGRYLLNNPADANTPLGANLWQWDKLASVSVNFPPLRDPLFDSPPILGDNWTLGLNTERVTDYALQPDAGGLSPVNSHAPLFTAKDDGVSNSVYAQWQRANTTTHPYDYGPQHGQITTLGVEQGFPWLGGNQTFTRLWADHRFYTPLPWGHDNSLAIRATGGLVYNRDGEFYYSIWQSPFGYQPLSTVNRWDLTSASSYNNRAVMLRGYPFLLGNRNASLGFEYRFPLMEVERGLQGPLFIDRLYGVAFWDNGFFWGLDSTKLDLPTLNDFKSGIGFELRAQTTSFQSVPIDFRLGVARGLTTGGEFEPNFGLGTTF